MRKSRENPANLQTQDEIHNNVMTQLLRDAAIKHDLDHIRDRLITVPLDPISHLQVNQWALHALRTRLPQTAAHIDTTLLHFAEGQAQARNEFNEFGEDKRLKVRKLQVNAPYYKPANQPLNMHPQQ